MSFWLLKTEPSSYSFRDLQLDGKTAWEGVKNNLALNYLRTMRKGDAAVIYHTGKEKALVGIAEVVSDAYPDPVRDDGLLTVVDVKARRPLARTVTLGEIKSRKEFASFELLRLPRLSVVPVSPGMWKGLMRLAAEKGSAA